MSEIDSIVRYKIVLKPINTKGMLLNHLIKHDCVPHGTITSGENIEKVEQKKILGNVITLD